MYILGKKIHNIYHPVTSPVTHKGRGTKHLTETLIELTRLGHDSLTEAITLFRMI